MKHILLVLFVLTTYMAMAQSSRFTTLCVKKENGIPDTVTDKSYGCGYQNPHSDTLIMGDSVTVYIETVYMDFSKVDTVNGEFFLQLSSNPCSPKFEGSTFTICKYADLKKRFIKNLGTAFARKNVYAFKIKLSCVQNIAGNRLFGFQFSYSGPGQYTNDGSTVYIKSNTTGIEELNSSRRQISTENYNLIGQKIIKPPVGLYIQRKLFDDGYIIIEKKYNPSTLSQ